MVFFIRILAKKKKNFLTCSSNQILWESRPRRAQCTEHSDPEAIRWSVLYMEKKKEGKADSQLIRRKSKLIAIWGAQPLMYEALGKQDSSNDIIKELARILEPTRH